MGSESIIFFGYLKWPLGYKLHLNEPIDLIKEIILTLSDPDKKEFEQFISRKRPVKSRKDVDIFRKLFSMYNGNISIKNDLVGNQNYHAIR